jgi:dTMP kinase
MIEMSTSKTSLFISFEGIDGCGKSTQVKMLIEKFERKKIDYLLVREPGGTFISEKIRKILLDKDLREMNPRTEALLMIASRAQLTNEIIIPKLKSGYVIISDRYIDSTIAYQGAGRGLSIDLLDKINNFATYELKPDITFLIDISSKLAAERRKKSELDRIEKVGNKFQEQVRDQYLKLASRNKNRFVTLDGKPTPEYIHNIIWNNFKIEKKKREL